MKILLVGSEKEYNLEFFYKKNLDELNVDCDIYPAHDLFLNYFQSSIYHKIFFRLGISRIYKKINSDFLSFLKKKKYDVILIFKGMEIFPETLKLINKQNMVLCNYNADHPFQFTGKGSGNSNVTSGIGLYDAYFTYHKGVMEEYKRRGIGNVFYLPFGYNQAPLKIPAEEDEIKKVCFIGFCDDSRFEVIQDLLDNNIPVDVYGPGWSERNFTNEHLINKYPPTYNEELNVIAIKYRVQLNLFRKHNDNSHNMRSFEMPGIGAIMLAPDSPEHRLFFADGEEVFFAKDRTERIDKIRFLLDLPYAESIIIREAAYNRCLDSKYSYYFRSKELLADLRLLLDSSK